MGFFDIFKRRKKETTQNVVESKETKQNDNSVLNDEEKSVVNFELMMFFPLTGEWNISCLGRSDNLNIANLPCHLRDNEWISKYIEKMTIKDGYFVSSEKIKKYIDSSEKFNNLRHEHELEIVKWQIEQMMNGGDQWLIKRGMSKDAMFTSPDVVELFRDGVARTLSLIGMNSEVVEEGIEKNAGLFRDQCIKQGYVNVFEPFLMKYSAPNLIDEKHKNNWIRAKKHEYYCNHKQSVDKYGKHDSDMMLNPEDAEKLNKYLEKENLLRLRVIENWKNDKIKNTESSEGKNQEGNKELGE